MTYIKEVIFVSVICGIITKLPISDEKGTERFVKFIASIAFLFVILSPISATSSVCFQIYNGLENIGDKGIESSDDTEFYTGTLEVIAEEICKTAANRAAEEFSVPEDSFSIKLILNGNDFEDIKIEDATVYVNNSASHIDISVLQDYFKKMLNTHPEVIMSE